MRHTSTAVCAVLCACLFAPTDSLAQSTIYLRMLPEFTVLYAAHTKQVTSATGSSSSSSSTSTPEVGINVYIGYLTPVSGDWLIGGEFRGTLAHRPTIESDTPAAGSGTHAVWPGPWDVANRAGLGANILIGRNLTFKDSRGYFFAGFARWASDFRSAGDDPVSEERIDDRVKTGRWPLTAGIGLTVPFARPMDVRLRYSRSATGWSVSHDFNDNELEFDYSFVVHGLSLSVGLGTR